MLKVLLADDEPIIIRGLKKLLPWQQYGLVIVGEAYNGVDLVKEVQEKSPHIIISDISMPGLTGIEAVERILELQPDSKVIFISAFKDCSYTNAAMKLGAIDYLVKPINKLALESAILNTVSLINQQ